MSSKISPPASKISKIIISNMSGNIETISNPSIDNPSTRPLGNDPVGNDPVEELFPPTPTEHDPPPVQPTWEATELGEETSSKQTTNNPTSQPAAQPTYDWNSHMQQFDFENRHRTPGIKTPGIKTPAQHMKTLKSSVYKRDLHIDSDSTQSKHIKLDKHAYPYFKTTKFYQPHVTPGLMHDSFINYLQFILSMPKFPPKLKSYLELGQMHLPHLLVNAFGGSFTALAQRLCGISPSFFLSSHKYPSMLTNSLRRL